MVLRWLVRALVRKAAHAMRTSGEKLDHTFGDQRYQPAFFALICSAAGEWSSSDLGEPEQFPDTLSQLTAHGVPEKEGVAHVRLLLSLLESSERSEHLLSFASALDQSGEWDKAIRVYEIAADDDNSIAEYARNCIEDIRSKQTMDEQT